MAAKLILMRHGQSVWNKANLFTGWVDVPLSEKGVNEALEGGKRIADEPIDVIYTSTLIRAQMTAMLAMLHHHSGKTMRIVHEGKLEEWAKSYGSAKTMLVYEAWELNERMYGELQGCNKDEMRAKFGKEQVHTWRRSYDVAPPNGESLKDTADRAVPYFNEKIVPELQAGRNVFVAAHGNSLRAIIGLELEKMSPEEVVKLELATGEPMIYEYKDGAFARIPG